MPKPVEVSCQKQERESVPKREDVRRKETMTFKGEPVVVQGTAVASPYDHSTPAPSGAATGQAASDPGQHGEKQETRCRDPIFAFLLYGNVAAIVAVAGIYGTAAFNQSLDEATSGSNYIGYIIAAIILGIIALVLAGLTLPVLMCMPAALIKVSLVGMIILSGAMVVIAFMNGSIFGGIIGAIFFLVFLCYAKAVWSRIPFAAVNLLTACTAVRKNCGAIVIAYFMTALTFAWAVLWTISLMGVWEEVVTKNCVGTQSECLAQTSSVNYGYLFLLFLSLFFTEQVIQNTTHVIVAGTVGGWWFSNEGGCCSAGVMGSTIRALTTSFGSICFGSLLVAILQALKALANSARNNENQIAICIAECIIGCLESILEYFNKWAFVYVGLYGYSYIEAGKNVIQLFKNRGWEAIIADDLVGNVFFFLSLAVGLLCCAIGAAFNDKTQFFVEYAPAPGNVQATCAGIGFIMGLMLTSILMSTIASAVNTVIVCFAEGPAEFEANHPELSQKMRATWLEFYPSSGV